MNMDMIGRMREQLVLQGIGSSPYWAGAIERRNAVTGLSLSLQNDCNLPTDASSFFRRGVPILSAFTGSHAEYHTPRDVPELINYEGAADTAKLMALITRDLLQTTEPLIFTEQEIQKTQVASLRASLGTIPNYTKEVKGAPLDGVAKGGPAEQAGLKGGDIITEWAGPRSRMSTTIRMRSKHSKSTKKSKSSSIATARNWNSRSPRGAVNNLRPGDLPPLWDGPGLSET